MQEHIAVLLDEVIEYLDPQTGQHFIDATYGFGGHSNAILQRTAPDGNILAIDANPEARVVGDETRIKLINNNFVNLVNIYEQFFPYSVSGILFDLGLSTILLEKSGRGFSFLREEPLDMRFNPDSQTLLASEVLNSYSLENLITVFWEFGEYTNSRRLARRIKEVRKKNKFRTTGDLVKVVLEIDRRRGRIHPATKVFQALRIEVNHELDYLKEGLEQAMDILKSNGRLVVISFHSLEDRIVKNYFRDLYKEKKVKLLTKKPIVASREEIKINARSRSAKLRAIEII